MMPAPLSAEVREHVLAEMARLTEEFKAIVEQQSPEVQKLMAPMVAELEAEQEDLRRRDSTPSR